jgi:hypothetical protein
MSTAEMKLELIRVIDRMTEQELKAIQQIIVDFQAKGETPAPRRRLGAFQ